MTTNLLGKIRTTEIITSRERNRTNIFMDKWELWLEPLSWAHIPGCALICRSQPWESLLWLFLMPHFFLIFFLTEVDHEFDHCSTAETPNPSQKQQRTCGGTGAGGQDRQSSTPGLQFTAPKCHSSPGSNTEMLQDWHSLEIPSWWSILPVK